MRDKRGQVTLFIIIAVVIVAVVVLFFMFREKIFAPKPELKVPAEAAEIYDYTQDCVKATSEDALILVGLQGGFAEPPSPYLDTNYSKIAFWAYNGADKKPSLEEIEKQISLYIQYVLPICTADFPGFAEQGFEINAGEIESTTKIESDKIKVDVKWPLAISKGETTAEISDFSASIPVNFSRVYNEAGRITDAYASNPEWIDMDQLLESEFDVLIMPYSDAELIYSIADNKTIVAGQPYLFMFGIKLK
jgi:hypothetical protein